MLWLDLLQDTWTLWTHSKNIRFARLLFTLKQKQTEQPSIPLCEDSLSPDEKSLVYSIRSKTEAYNRNNITRTLAYYEFYRRHPEVHWALLAHLVSRNAGWNMTDLRGEWLTRLLSDEQQHAFFSFLERGNWLIFHDAFPQLLLYEAGRQQQRNLSHLLAYFGVSRFSTSIWDEFFHTGDSHLLTVGLIINEQSYIEDRVIQNLHYRKTVLQTMDFILQDILGLNHILFPRQASDTANTQIACPLCGCCVHHFDSLRKRILMGKQLYAALFGQPVVLDEVLRWADAHSHTGSRSDYWPHLFGTVQKAGPHAPYIPHLSGTKLKPGVPRLYSPQLVDAWSDTVQSPAELGDWFCDWRIASHLLAPCKTDIADMLTPYCNSIEKVEMAVLGKQALASSSYA
ncbi:DUF2515 family protein [Aneurinibacillus sp. REN35]|uniref:DUF2515 family protein n=1 Tax=Aneurinibacillus sp. REN35 TaxID=3237286 RepID=UPI00352853D0